MDSLWQIGLTQLMALTSNYTSGWTTASANFGVMEMYSNNNDCANAACSSSTTTPGGDVGTNYDNSLGKLSQATYVPNPGNGTNQPGDTPQEVLFIVTDGVEDEESGRAASNRQSTISAATPARPYGNSTRNQLVHDDQEPWHQDRDPLHRLSRCAGQQLVPEPYRPLPIPDQRRPQACATPGLFIDEANDAQIGQDLANLFNLARSPRPPDPIGPRAKSSVKSRQKCLDLVERTMGETLAHKFTRANDFKSLPALLRNFFRPRTMLQPPRRANA